MKLLFEENLSPKMVEALADVFPDSAHVDRIGLGGGSDDDVWRYAKDNGFMLVSRIPIFTKRASFTDTRQRSFGLGAATAPTGKFNCC